MLVGVGNFGKVGGGRSPSATLNETTN